MRIIGLYTAQYEFFILSSSILYPASRKDSYKSLPNAHPRPSLQHRYFHSYLIASTGFAVAARITR